LQLCQKVVLESGHPERALSTQYQKQADEVENAVFVGLAATMRGLAESYSREAVEFRQDVSSRVSQRSVWFVFSSLDGKV